MDKHDKASPIEEGYVAHNAEEGYMPHNPSPPVSEAETLASDVALKPVGVLKVEAAQVAWNEKTKWILFISLNLAAYVYSLDGMTTYLYNINA